MDNNIVFHNGHYQRYKDVKMGFLVYSLSYGLSVNDNIRIYKNNNIVLVIGFDNYINRFISSCKKMGIILNYGLSDIKRIIINIIKLNKNIKHPYIRLLGYFGDSLNPIPTINKSMFSIGIIDLNININKVALTISSKRRVKNYINSIKLSKNYAQNYLDNFKYIKKGYNNVIILDKKGNVLETLNHNIFIVRKNKVFTPPIGNIIPGVIRKLVINICKKLDIEIYEENIKEDKLYISDEVFITSTAFGIISVKSIGEKYYNSFSFTNKISDFIEKELFFYNKIDNIYITKLSLGKIY